MAFLTIIFICYIVVALIRKTPLRNEWLPLISGGIGIVLSLIAFYALPSIVSADSLGTTLFYGFFSGLRVPCRLTIQESKYLKYLLRYNV